MISLQSPAKINLFLRILYKRSDGYHELASLFQSINLCDRLHFIEATEDYLSSTDPTLSCSSDNTVIRALTLFRERTGMTKRFHIHLEKQIPQEAGLGGGSSNCATTLYALNQYTNCKVPEEELRRWSSEISADAPFFFSSGTAYCQGIGEQVCSLPPLSYLEDKKIVIFKPKEGISTKRIFSLFDFHHCDPRSPEELLHAALVGAPSFTNDLESIVYQISPSLAKLRKQLSENEWDGLFMTGSGSAHVALTSEARPISCSDRETALYSTLPLYRTADGWY